MAQSFAGWPYAREGGPVKTEEEPLDPNPPPALRSALEAIRELEATVLATKGAESVVLRYGVFYGPGTSLGEGGSIADDVRRRRIPIVGRGTGVWSFIHIDDASAATLAALERGAPGIYNIVDDDPAPVADWLPARTGVALDSGRGAARSSGAQVGQEASVEGARSAGSGGNTWTSGLRTLGESRRSSGACHG